MHPNKNQKKKKELRTISLTRPKHQSTPTCSPKFWPIDRPINIINQRRWSSQIFSSFAAFTTGFAFAIASFPTVLKSNVQSCFSGYLWLPQNVVPHLHVNPVSPTRFLHDPHRFRCCGFPTADDGVSGSASAGLDIDWSGIGKTETDTSAEAEEEEDSVTAISDWSCGCVRLFSTAIFAVDICLSLQQWSL